MSIMLLEIDFKIIDILLEQQERDKNSNPYLISIIKDLFLISLLPVRNAFYELANSSFRISQFFCQLGTGHIPHMFFYIMHNIIFGI